MHRFRGNYLFVLVGAVLICAVRGVLGAIMAALVDQTGGVLLAAICGGGVIQPETRLEAFGVPPVAEGGSRRQVLIVALVVLCVYMGMLSMLCSACLKGLVGGGLLCLLHAALRTRPMVAGAISRARDIARNLFKEE